MGFYSKIYEILDRAFYIFPGSDWAGGLPGDSRWAGGHQKIWAGPGIGDIYRQPSRALNFLGAPIFRKKTLKNNNFIIEIVHKSNKLN